MGAGAGRSPRAAGMALELSLRTMDLQNRAPGRLQGWLRLVPGRGRRWPRAPGAVRGLCSKPGGGCLQAAAPFLAAFPAVVEVRGRHVPESGASGAAGVPHTGRRELPTALGARWPRALGSCRQDGAERVLQPVLRGQSSFAFPGAAVPFPPAFRLRVTCRGALGAGELRGGLAAPRCPTCRLS